MKLFWIIMTVMGYFIIILTCIIVMLFLAWIAKFELESFFELSVDDLLLKITGKNNKTEPNKVVVKKHVKLNE